MARPTFRYRRGAPIAFDLVVSDPGTIAPAALAALIGPPGPAGPPGNGQRFNVTAASAEWIIAHGLGRVPAVQVYRTSGEAVRVEQADEFFIDTGLDEKAIRRSVVDGWAAMGVESDLHV